MEKPVRHIRDNFPDAGKHRRRQKRFPLFICQRTAQIQPLRRTGHRLIEQKRFGHQPLLGCRRELHAHFREPFPLRLVQHAVFLRLEGNDSFVDPKQKESPYIRLAGTLHRPDQYLIQRRRHQAKLNAFQSALQDAGKRVDVHLLLAHHFDDLVKEAHQPVPDLSVHLGIVQLSRLLCRSLPLFQYAWYVETDQKAVESCRHRADIFLFRLLQLFFKPAQGRCVLSSQFICRLILRRLSAKPPRLLIRPIRAVYAMCQHIVFQQVDFSPNHVQWNLLPAVGNASLRCDQICLQAAEYRFIPPSGRDHLQSGTDQFHQRMVHDRALLIQEERDPVIGKHGRKLVRIGADLAQQYRHVAPAIPLRARKLENLQSDRFHLGPAIGGRQQTYFIRSCGRRRSTRVSPRKVTILQLAKPRTAGKSPRPGQQNRAFDRYTRFFGHLLQCLVGAQSRMKQSELIRGGIPFGRVEAKRNRDLFGADHQLLDHPQLLVRKSAETVDKNLGLGDVSGIFDHDSNAVQNIVRIPVPLGEMSLVRIHDQSQIMYFLIERPASPIDVFRMGKADAV